MVTFLKFIDFETMFICLYLYILYIFLKNKIQKKKK